MPKSNVTKEDALKLLKMLGFPKAAEWDDAKLKARCASIPSKVKASELKELGVTDEGKKIYESLVAAGGAIDLPTPEKGKKAAAAPKKEAVAKDEFGCKEGTISAKVNKVVGDEWIEEDEVAKAAGVDRDQARGRLYYACEKGEFVSRRLIQYRRANEEEKKAAKRAAAKKEKAAEPVEAPAPEKKPAKKK